MPDPQSNPDLVADCETLLDLRDALEGDAALNWSNSTPLRDWEGVVVGANPLRVVSLHINGRGLTGVIPPELGRLEKLRILNLSHNRLNGVIPPELSNLSDLRFLLLHVNNLSGNIPVEFGLLKYLVTLDLGQNQLTGSIPVQLGSLPNLESLFIGANSLSGIVPPELAQLPIIRSIDISGNSLRECVPDELREANIRTGGMRFCGEPDPARLRSVFTDRPVLKGGIDLGVTYIERLPRYQRYRLAYFHGGECTYPYDEFKGAVVCPSQEGIKRWPDPGEPIELTAFVWNFGNRVSGPFDYEWKLNDETLEAGRHGGLESGKYAEFTLSTEWPGDESNPTAFTFSVDTQNEIEELIEDNNALVDWIKGYTLGFYFSLEAYESLSLSTRVGRKFQSPEHWVHQQLSSNEQDVCRVWPK